MEFFAPASSFPSAASVNAFDAKQVVMTPAMLQTKTPDDELIEYVTSLIESSFFPPTPESLPQTTRRRQLRDKALSSQQTEKPNVSANQYAEASDREKLRHRLRRMFYLLYSEHQFQQQKEKILILSSDGIHSLQYVATEEGEQTARLEIGKRFRGEVIFMMPASGYWESEFLCEYGRSNEKYPVRDNNLGLLVRV